METLEERALLRIDLDTFEVPLSGRQGEALFSFW